MLSKFDIFDYMTKVTNYGSEPTEKNKIDDIIRQFGEKGVTTKPP